MARQSRALVLGACLAATSAFRIPFSMPVPVAPGTPDYCGTEPLGPSRVMNEALVGSLKGVIDIAYTGRDIPRFFVLETLARVPYFSYLSCLHLHESLGMRGNAQLMRTHYAEADNELHHLLIMESLGGGDAYADRFVAQHLAFFYYWYCVALYLVNPRASYHLSELIEEHAYHTYDQYVKEHEASLKKQPVPEVARRYYEGNDAMRNLATHGAADGAGKHLHSLYDVFVHVRDDEAAHWDTLERLVSYDSLDAPDGCDVAELIPA